MGDGGHTWFVRDGRPRALWRVLLFVGVFILLVLTGLLLLAPVLDALPAGDGVSPALTLEAAVQLAAALAAAWVMLRWIDARPLRGLGFPLDRRVPRALGMGLAIGVAGVGGIVLLLTLAGGYRYTAEPGSIVGWMAGATGTLAVLVLPAVAEEAIFRGYLLRALVEGAGAAVAVLVTSLLFGLLHGWNPNVTTFGLVNIILAGVLLAVAVLRTGALWFASAVHLGWNWIIAGPLDLPVSGLEAYDMPLYDALSTGPVWLTGGAFGPEGGVAGTLAALAVLGLVILATRPGGRLTTQPADGNGERVHDR